MFMFLLRSRRDYVAAGTLAPSVRYTQVLATIFPKKILVIDDGLLPVLQMSSQMLAVFLNLKKDISIPLFCSLYKSSLNISITLCNLILQLFGVFFGMHLWVAMAFLPEENIFYLIPPVHKKPF